MGHSKALWTILITLILASLALLVFSFPIVHRDLLGFESPNALGDYTAGVAGPIIALGASYLVYVTIKEQVEANRIQREALKSETEYRDQRDFLERISKAIDDVEGHIQRLSFTYKASDQYNTVTGITAIEICNQAYLDRRDGTYESLLFQFIHIMSSLFVIRDDMIQYRNHLVLEREWNRVSRIYEGQIGSFVKQWTIGITDDNTQRYNSTRLKLKHYNTFFQSLETDFKGHGIENNN